ncbi:hypothetical protein [Paraburkholderia sp. XV]|uniref:hypothetical protein n=1 Tax=Paraburkholderia sp. XV TaxID=2831520 RepID=UPI001CD3271C|nr:hypothetical protein [Paraburkholderia sp. XV]
MQGKTLFLERAVSRALDWLGRYPALGCASHDPQSISSGRQVVAASLTDDGVRCVFFSAVGSVLDFTATWAELERAKTWWYFVQRWYFWVVPDEQTLETINVTASMLDHLVVPSRVDHASDESYLRWLDNIEARARLCGRLAASRLELETV